MERGRPRVEFGALLGREPRPEAVALGLVEVAVLVPELGQRDAVAVELREAPHRVERARLVHLAVHLVAVRFRAPVQFREAPLLSNGDVTSRVQRRAIPKRDFGPRLPEIFEER